MNVIETRALSKHYGSTIAVDRFNMHVSKGEIYGFVGRNGAGKSTVMKLLSGLVYPTEGEAFVLGAAAGTAAGAQKPTANIGVLIERPGIYQHMSAYDNMMLKALCLGVIEPKQECLELLTYVGLGDVAKKKVAKFSMGMQQRLGFALALLGNPDVLLLDEPLNGLDPEGVRDMRHLILELNEDRGVTVLISSHVLEQLERIATVYGVIKSGHMVREFTAAELEEECRDYVRLRTSNPSLTLALLNEQLPSVACKALDDGSIEIRGEQNTDRIAALIGKTDMDIKELYVCSRDTEDYFVELMGDETHA